MPKTFSKEERDYIDNRLKEEATYCLVNFGVKGTTVDELIKRVNIPKGTFYLFYKSKELLLFKVLEEIHDSMEAKFIADLENLSDKLDIDTITSVIYGFYKETEKSGVLRVLTSGDIELIYRKLSVEVLQNHVEQDDKIAEAILKVLKKESSNNVEIISAALRGIFMQMVHSREIGQEYADEVLKISIRGLVIQILE